MAQPDEEMQTLFNHEGITVGTYGGIGTAFSSFAGQDTWLVGGNGVTILNKLYALGVAGYGIVNSPKF